MVSHRSVSSALVVLLLACAAETEPEERRMPADEGPQAGGHGGSAQAGTSQTVPQGGSVSSSAGSGAGATTSNGGSAGSGGGGGSGTSGSTSAGTSGTTSSGGSLGSGVELLFEDFEDGVADGWIAGKDDEGADLGTWTVTSGIFQAEEVTSDPSWAVGGDLSWTDQLVETKVRFSADAIEDATVFLVARFQNFDSYIFMEFYGDGHLKIRVKTEGSTSDLGDYDYSEVPTTPDTWHSIALGVKGSEVKGYYNGAEVLSASDASLPSGGVALAARDTAAAFDDIKVSVP